MNVQPAELCSGTGSAGMEVKNWGNVVYAHGPELRQLVDIKTPDCPHGGGCPGKHCYYGKDILDTDWSLQQHIDKIIKQEAKHFDVILVLAPTPCCSHSQYVGPYRAIGLTLSCAGCHWTGTKSHTAESPHTYQVQKGYNES